MRFKPRRKRFDATLLHVRVTCECMDDMPLPYDLSTIERDETISIFEGVICLACGGVHLVNPKTGKVLGAVEKANPQQHIAV